MKERQTELEAPLNILFELERSSRAAFWTVNCPFIATEPLFITDSII